MRKVLVCTILLSVLHVSAAAEEIRTVPLFRRGTSTQGSRIGELKVADVFRDGKADIISCNSGAPFVLSYSNGIYVPAWHGPSVACEDITVGDSDGDGGTEIIVTTEYTSANPSRLMIFDPRSLGAAARSVITPDEDSQVAFGNVDLDAGPEIIVSIDSTSNPTTYVYDGATLAVEWQSYGGRDVLVGDVDGGARNEIVVNTPTVGRVLDAGEKVLKWSHGESFGWWRHSVTLGNVNADTNAEIVYTDRFRLKILDGDTRAVTTIAEDSRLIDAVAVGDADGDGVNEIITGNDQFGSIIGRRPSDGAELWSIPSPDHGTNALNLGDLDGDGTAEVVWMGADLLSIGDAASEQVEWFSKDSGQWFSSAVGDLNGDGRFENVIAGAYSRDGDPGIIEVFDAATGTPQGTIRRSALQPGVFRVAIGQVDSDPAREVIAFGGSTVVAFDGVTRFIEFQGTGHPELVGDTGIVANIDDDPRDEIIVGTSDGKVVVFDGATDQIQRSYPVEGIVRSLAVADLGGSAAAELVIGTSTGLFVLDPATGAQLGSAAVRVRTVAATSTGGGIVAAGTEDSEAIVQVFDGVTLKPRLVCSKYARAEAMTFLEVENATRLAYSSPNGTLYFIDARSATCSEPHTLTSLTEAGRLQAVDVNGDGRQELIVGRLGMAELFTVALPGEPPGDADGNGVIAQTDVDAIVDHVLAGDDGISALADMNGDQRISAEDALALIRQLAGQVQP